VGRPEILSRDATASLFKIDVVYCKVEERGFLKQQVFELKKICVNYSETLYETMKIMINRKFREQNKSESYMLQGSIRASVEHAKKMNIVEFSNTSKKKSVKRLKKKEPWKDNRTEFFAKRVEDRYVNEVDQFVDSDRDLGPEDFKILLEALSKERKRGGRHIVQNIVNSKTSEEVMEVLAESTFLLRGHTLSKKQVDEVKQVCSGLEPMEIDGEVTRDH
jgi:hypothetical protein